MIAKTLIILANSYKNSERCIAGRELTTTHGRFFLRSWIRPISTHGQGELDCLETAHRDATQVACLDIATVKLIKPAADPGQPENWLITGQYAWSHPPTKFLPPPLARLEEKPAHLWLTPNERTDRIPVETLQKNPPPFSICIIRPLDLHLVCWSEHNVLKNCESRKFRARFTYEKVEYDLSLTDPVAQERFCLPVPPIGAPPKIIPLRSDSGPLLCVSLTPPFNGYHYKVAATILGM